MMNRVHGFRNFSSNEQPVGEKASATPPDRLDIAARAAWHYYIRGLTQDEVAAELSISRQLAQRLVALARSEGLIQFRLAHHLSASIELSHRLQGRYELGYCEVAPSAHGGGDNQMSAAIYAGRYIESMLLGKEPIGLALGAGPVLRAAMRHVAAMSRPQHKIISLVGSVGSGGRATSYDAAVHLSERIGGQCFPMPLPLLANTRFERELLQAQHGYQAVKRLAQSADVWIVGINELGRDSTLRVDGFVSDAELGALVEKGAVGEVMGWTFDANGKFVSTELHDRITAVPLCRRPRQTVIAVGTGQTKVPAIVGALRGQFISGLVTDEATAQAVLDT